MINVFQTNGQNRGDLYGKFIILSFDENEEAIFSNTVMTLSAVSDFFSLAASDDTPLFGSGETNLQVSGVRNQI